MAPRSKLVAYHPVHGYAIQPQQDLKTIKRNARERNRVQTVNKTFETLKQHVPSAAVYKKLSKLNIVHHAMQYIHQLVYMLHSDQLSPGYGCTQTPSPSCMVGDYSYHQQPAMINHQHSLTSPSVPPTPSPHFTFPSTYFPSPSSQLPSPSAATTNPSSYPSPSPSSIISFPSPWTSSMQNSPSADSGYGDYIGRGNSVTRAAAYNDQQSKMYSVHQEEDDVLDAIVDWQTM